MDNNHTLQSVCDSIFKLFGEFFSLFHIDQKCSFLFFFVVTLLNYYYRYHDSFMFQLRFIITKIVFIKAYMDAIECALHMRLPLNAEKMSLFSWSNRFIVRLATEKRAYTVHSGKKWSPFIIIIHTGCLLLRSNIIIRWLMLWTHLTPFQLTWI